MCYLLSIQEASDQVQGVKVLALVLLLLHFLNVDGDEVEYLYLEVFNLLELVLL